MGVRRGFRRLRPCGSRPAPFPPPFRGREEGARALVEKYIVNQENGGAISRCNVGRDRDEPFHPSGGRTESVPLPGGDDRRHPCCLRLRPAEQDKKSIMADSYPIRPVAHEESAAFRDVGDHAFLSASIPPESQRSW